MQIGTAGRRRAGILGAATSAIALVAGLGAAPADAQDVVVMRRVIAPPQRSATTPTPSPTATSTPTPTPTSTGPRSYYSWQVTPWTQAAGACGTIGTETRDVTCMRTDGVVVPDANCTVDNSGPRPVTSQPVTITASCGYAWNAGAWSQAAASCGPTQVTRTVTCQRADGTIVGNSNCGDQSAMPATSETVADYAGCSYAWASGQWQGSGCGAVTQTRSVLCQRSDGTPADDAQCSAIAAKPSTTQQITDASTCQYSWQTGSFGAAAPACGASTHTRSVTCQRSDGTPADDALCTGDKPATSEAVTDLSTCVYGWKAGAFGAPSTTCGDATSSRTVSCVDQNGNPAPSASSCAATGAPPTTQTTHETSGCSFSWQAGGFGAPQPACGATVQTQTVTCQRSDGTPVGASSCDPAAMPAASQPATDYTACTFGWYTGAYGAWSTTCGDATQTRDVHCQRSDGTSADDSSCTGTKPSTTSDVVHQTSGCGYAWIQGGFGAPTPACGATTQTQTVVCQRSDGVTVTGDDEQSCANSQGAKPATTQAATDYSTCTFDWSYGAYGPWSTTCGDATQTRSATCSRSDGTQSADTSPCVAAKGQAVTTSPVVHQTTGCGYAWTPGPWGATVPACGPSTRSRSFTCVRSDGQTMTDTSFCGTNGQSATDNTVSDYSTCTFDWSYSAYTPWSTSCGDATQTRVATCKRSDGQIQGDTTPSGDTSSCVAAHGQATGLTQSAHQTSGCGYTWTPGAWTTVPACGATTQTRTFSCVRGDGVTVTGAEAQNCGTNNQPTTQAAPGPDYSACTFKWNPSPWQGTAACGNSVTQNRTVTCQRSDGTDNMGDAACSGAGAKPATTQTVTDTSQCTYSWPASYGATAAACGPSSRPVTYPTCQRSDGTPVTDQATITANCGPAPAASTDTSVKDYSTCSYTWSYGAWNGSGSGVCGSTYTQTRSVSCDRSDGTKGVAASNCSSATQPSSSQTLTDTTNCSYTWQVASATAWSNACGKGATRTTTYQCQRSDGAQNQAAAYCGTPPTGTSGSPPSGTQTADYPACGITNGDFENGFTNWTADGGGSYTAGTLTTAQAGSGMSGNTMTLTNNNGQGYATTHLRYKGFACTAGTTYAVSFRYKIVTYGMAMNVNAFNNSFGSVNTSGSWATYSATSKSAITNKDCSLDIQLQNTIGVSSGTAIIDNVSVTAQ